MTPFVVLAIPRSRTFWLSKFLSYGDYECGHEDLRHFRTMADVKSWLSQDYVGSCETAAAPFWRLIPKFRPETKIVVVRRPVDECVDSMMAVDMKGVCRYDRAFLTKRFRYLDAKLDQIEKRASNVLAVQFRDLQEEATCARVFEHCLPYKHDSERWKQMANTDMQCSMPAITRYAIAHQPQILKAIALAKQAILSDIQRHSPVPMDGMEFAQEPFDVWFWDAQPLFNEHMAVTDQSPGDQHKKNIPLLRVLDRIGAMQITTARCNGRMFGYLMTLVAPSLDDPNILTSQNLAFFASKDAPGLGMKLQRASIEALRRRGVRELHMREGVRGSGPKLGAIYRRLGAEDHGRLYRLELENV